MRSPHRISAPAALLLVGCQLVLGMEDSHLRADGGVTNTGTTASGTAGSGGSSGTEDCTNGVDDDHNGAVDCEDPYCSDHECVELPAGWLGPIQVAAGNSAISCLSSPSSMLGGRGTVTIFGADCASCACNVQGGDCTATVEVYTTSTCSSGPSDTGSGYGCFDLDPPGSPILDGAIANVTGTFGSCEPTGGGLSSPLEPPAFDETYQYCDLPVGQGCGTGRCVPPTGTQWTGPCVYQHADVACDAAPFTQKLTLQTVASDDRGCSECTCALERTCSDSIVMLFALDGCAGEPESTPADQQCHPFQSAQVVQSAYLSDAPCDASGGEPHGDVTLQTTTLCCANL